MLGGQRVGDGIASLLKTIKENAISCCTDSLLETDGQSSVTVLSAAADRHGASKCRILTRPWPQAVKNQKGKKKATKKDFDTSLPSSMHSLQETVVQHTNAAFQFENKKKTSQAHSRQHAVDRLGDGRALHRLTRRPQPLHPEPRACVSIKSNIFSLVFGQLAISYFSQLHPHTDEQLHVIVYPIRTRERRLHEPQL